MVIDMDLFLDIVDITKKDYDVNPLGIEDDKVMVRDITELLEDLVEYVKELGK